MRVLVCGARNWDDMLTIVQRLKLLPPDTVIVHGGATGADSQADAVGKVLGFKVEPYPADWTKYGKAAGPIRNRQMLDTNPNLVLAFHDNLEASKGTRDCVDEARRRGTAVEVHRSVHASDR